MRKMIFGPCGSGKTRIAVKSEIEKAQETLIWISAKDEVKYLNLENEVKKKTIRELEKTTIDGKINITISPSEIIGEKEKKILKDFLFCGFQKGTYLIVDEAANIANTIGYELFGKILNDANHFKKIMLVFQDIRQLEMILKESKLKESVRWDITNMADIYVPANSL